MTTWRPPGEKFIGVAVGDKRGLLAVRAVVGVVVAVPVDFPPGGHC